MADIKEEILNSWNVIVRAAVGRGGRLSIAFGAERLALIPFRKPAATVLIAVALAVLAILGIQRIRIEDSLSQLFHSESPAFKLFEQVSRFPSSEYDVMIVVTGNSLLDRELVENCARWSPTCNSSRGRAALFRCFPRASPPREAACQSRVSRALAARVGYDELVERVLNNDIIHGRLLSADGRLALIVLSLEPSTVDGGRLASIVNDIRQTMAEDLQGTGLAAELTGAPVMQLEIRYALERDRILYNAVGFARAASSRRSSSAGCH